MLHHFHNYDRDMYGKYYHDFVYIKCRQGPREGGEMMTKNSVKLYFTGEGSDGSKRNFSRTVNYIREGASNEDLKVFKAAFGVLLAKEITKLERITVTEL